MSLLVLDTRALVWAFLEPARLSQAAWAAIQAANSQGEAVFVSAISLIDVVYLMERSRISSNALAVIEAEFDSQQANLKLANIDRAIVDAVQSVPRTVVPDMPDRIIAATAMYLQSPLVTRDTRLQTLPIVTIW